MSQLAGLALDGLGCPHGGRTWCGSDWISVAKTAAGLVGTPCYGSVLDLVAELVELFAPRSDMCSRHWLSLMTQPVKALLEAWRDWGLGVEVVSAYELMAALDARMPPRRILVNGVAKHTWLTTFDVCELNVHFDSLREVERLGQIAHRRGWRVGVRCQVPNQRDPENQEFADQFGMCLEEAVRAVCFLSRCGVAVSGLHFHLGGNVASTREYIVALHHLRRVADACRLEPTYVDIGGGLPPEGHHFDWEDYGGLDVRIRDLFPSVREVWFENGRHITAGAGALV